MDNINNILCSLGYSCIWYSQRIENAKWLSKSSFQKLKDIFIQNWMSEVDTTSNTSFYKIYKSDFKNSTYINILPKYQCKMLFSFVTRNHRLPIEVGRWRSIPSNERICNYCGVLGDEFHYILQCPFFDEDRKRYVKPFYYTRPNILKLKS